MDRDFRSSLSLQNKLVELPNTSSSHQAAFMALILSPPETPTCSELAPSKLRNNLATECTKLQLPYARKMVRRNARSA